MSINDGILLVVLAFFGMILFSVHREDQRARARRRQDLPHPAERRASERRRRSLPATLLWALKAPWTRHRK